METLKAILYFSIFRYPLKFEEIHNYTNYEDADQTQNELNLLVNNKIITKIDEFYVYGNDLDSVTKRLRGNFNAIKIFQKAQKKAKFISKFPFVEAVGISGSLSKNYFDKDSDIDFFVITKPKRLWICRTLLMLYKKIFLLNSKKFFCINYFISSSKLEIKEKNRFTATELITLIPIHGKDIFEKFYQSNTWANEYYSKFTPNLDTITETKTPLLIKAFETITHNHFGESIDNLFRSITLKKWYSKFGHLEKSDFDVAMKSTKNISKHHPSNFQKKVIQALNNKLEEVEEKFNIKIVKEHE